MLVEVNTPVQALLYILCGVAILISSGLFILCDLFQTYAPDFPLFPSLASAIVFSWIPCLLTQLIGREQWGKHFVIFSPFLGGDAFLCLQCLGNAAVGAATVLGAGYYQLVCAAGRRPRYAVLSYCSCASVVGACLLLTSLRWYQEEMPHTTIPGSPDSIARSVVAKRHSFHRVIRAAILAVFISFLAGVSEILAGAMPHTAGVLSPLFLVLNVLAIVLLHGVVRSCRIPGYGIIMPFYGGGWKTVLSRGCAWCACLFSLLFVCMLHSSGAHSFLVCLVPALIGFCGVVAFAALLMSEMGLSTTETLGLENPNESVTVLSPLSSLTMRRQGCFFLTFISVLFSILALFFNYSPMLAHSLGFHRWPTPEVEEALRTGVRILCGSMLLDPPMTHCLGVIISESKTYSLWQPFDGSRLFIALQASGWACFSLSILFYVLTLTSPQALLSVPATTQVALALISQILIQASLQLWSLDYPHRRATKNLSEIETHSVDTTERFLHRVFNGEMLTSCALMCSSLCARVLHNFFVVGHAAKSFCVLLNVCKLVLYVLAFILAEVSYSRGHMKAHLGPFQGTNEYVALQAVGFTLFAVIILTSLHVLLVAEPKCSPSPVFFYSYDSGVALLSPADWILSPIPYIMIVCSIALQVRHEMESGEGLEPEEKVIPTGEDVEELKQLLKLSHGGTYVHKALSDLVRDAEVATNSIKRDRVFDEARSRARLSYVAFGLTMAISVVVLIVLATAASADPQRRLAVFVFLGAATTGLCLTVLYLHAFFGPFVNGISYRIVMPFKGGGAFVLLQACGWSCAAGHILLVLLYVFGALSGAVPLLNIGFFSVCSIVFILLSIERFDRDHSSSCDGVLGGFLEANAEGIVSLLLLLVTFTVMYVLQTFTTSKVGLLPPLVSVIGLSLSVPLAHAAMHKPHQTLLTNSEDIRAGAFMRSLLEILEYVFYISTGLVPLYVLYFSYYYVHGNERGLAFVRFAGKTVALIGAVMLAVILLARSISSIRPLRDLFKAWSMYLIPAYCAVIWLLPYAIFPCATTFAHLGYFCVLTFLPSFLLHIIWRPFTMLLLGYSLYQRCGEVAKIIRSGHVLASNTTDAGFIFVPHESVFFLIVAAAGVLLHALLDATICLFWFFYISTYDGNPSLTGEQYRQRVTEWFREHVIYNAASYFDFKVVDQGDFDNEDINNAKTPYPPAILCFHPHGIYPCTTQYMAQTREWIEKPRLQNYIGERIVTHGASIIFRVPFMRDIMLSMNIRDVSRESVNRCLRTGHSSVIVVGGQSELILNVSSPRETHLVTFHIGFARLALVHRRPIVPVYSFGENALFGNICVPRAQMWFLRVLHFPFPVFPMGFCGFPVPHKFPVRVVVGRPVHIDPEMADPLNPDHVHRLAERYFNALRKLFFQFREMCDYPEMRLFYHHNKNDLLSGEEQFADVATRIPNQELMTRKKKKE